MLFWEILKAGLGDYAEVITSTGFTRKVNFVSFVNVSGLEETCSCSVGVILF